MLFPYHISRRSRHCATEWSGCRSSSVGTPCSDEEDRPTVLTETATVINDDVPQTTPTFPYIGN